MRKEYYAFSATFKLTLQGLQHERVAADPEVIEKFKGQPSLKNYRVALLSYFHQPRGPKVRGEKEKMTRVV